MYILVLIKFHSYCWLGGNAISIQVLILHLRQVCGHPILMLVGLIPIGQPNCLINLGLISSLGPGRCTQWPNKDATGGERQRDCTGMTGVGEAVCWWGVFPCLNQSARANECHTTHRWSPSFANGQWNRTRWTGTMMKIGVGDVEKVGHHNVWHPKRSWWHYCSVQWQCYDCCMWTRGMCWYIISRSKMVSWVLSS
jgi:hypothetical protein